VRDGCSRRVIGWAIDEHLHTDLVTSAQLARFADRRNLARSVGCTASAPVVDAFDPVADAELSGRPGGPQTAVVELDFQGRPE
jgi:hypothetical protein